MRQYGNYKPTTKDVINAAELQVRELYEKHNTSLKESKIKSVTFTMDKETAQKAMSNNLPELIKAVNQRRQRKYLYITSFVAIIISITFWYWIFNLLIK